MRGLKHSAIYFDELSCNDKKGKENVAIYKPKKENNNRFKLLCVCADHLFEIIRQTFSGNRVDGSSYLFSAEGLEEQLPQDGKIEVRGFERDFTTAGYSFLLYHPSWKPLEAGEDIPRILYKLTVATYIQLF